MMMKKVLGAVAVLVAATSAHAQLSSRSTTGTVVSSSPSTFDVYFNVPVLSVGTGTLSFSLSSATDVTFSGYTNTPFATGELSGTGLATPLPFQYGTSAIATTIDLGPGSYTYTESSFAFPVMCPRLYVDIGAVSAVREPQSYGMLLAGMVVIGVTVRRRRMPVSRPTAMSC